MRTQRCVIHSPPQCVSLCHILQIRLFNSAVKASLLKQPNKHNTLQLKCMLLCSQSCSTLTTCIQRYTQYLPCLSHYTQIRRSKQASRSWQQPPPPVKEANLAHISLLVVKRLTMQAQLSHQSVQQRLKSPVKLPKNNSSYIVNITRSCIMAQQHLCSYKYYAETDYTDTPHSAGYSIILIQH